MKTLYHNGQFVPMTSEDDTFEALLVADDGTIAFTGSLVEARERAEDASEIDLAGKTVLPGFIDGHSHFTGTTQYLLNPDLSACRSFADIQNVLRDFIQKRGIDENGVVMAIGYDQNALAERRHPTKDVLDEVSRDIPIVVMQASNHMGVANSKALELTGITAETPDPEGSLYGRVEGTNEPNGYAEEPGALFPLYGMVQPRMNIDVPSMLDEMMSFYLEHGVTTCQEGAAQPDFTDMFAKIARDGKLKLDIVSYPMYDHDVDGQLERCAEFDGPDYIGHYRIGGLKMFLDGSPQGRTAWMTEPYEPGEDGAADYCGYGTMTDEDALAFAKKAVDSNHQLLTHTNGDAAGDQLIRVYKQALAAASRDDPLPDHASRPVPGDGRDQHDPLHFHVPHLVLGRRAPQELRPEARRPHQRCARRAGRGAALHLPHRYPRDPAQHVGNGLVRREPHHARRRPVGRRPEGGRVRRAQGHHRQRSLRVRRRGPQGNAGAGQAGRPGHSRCEPPQGGSDGHP